ncbi:unnamed protein product [Aphis gossypii]|uniref:Uncharacterized protein n=1 Tax=Aphis gossypii TaxID=80765 RepID=A0A9P0JBJ3_APHGO|nr:unnamed protein product [Aphis gossypii]
MFASMYKTLLNKSKINAKDKSIVEESETVKITSNDVKHLLNELNEIKDNSDNCSDVYDITDAIELLSIVDNHPGHLNDNTLVEYSDDTKNEVRSIGKNQIGVTTIKDRDMKKIVNKMNHLQCLFTWNVKSKNKNLILHIQNKYGEYNLNISSSEFTLERFIGNLIIFHELFHHGEPESAQIKILEIGKWLEELDKGTDEFYLSIKPGVQHIMKATFIHMLFAMNLTEECKWKHSSLFGSKPFNLSELICNEIRLATDLSGTSSDDMLYYFKTLPKIVETCNLKIQDVDSSMKSKLIVDSNVNSIFSNASVQSETESSDSESVKFKNLTEEILERNSKLYPYIQQLYQKILSNTHSRFNSPNVSSRDFNNYFNQNYANFSSQLQWNPFQDTPPFLSLIPQINPQNPKPKQKKNLKEK